MPDNHTSSRQQSVSKEYTRSTSPPPNIASIIPKRSSSRLSPTRKQQQSTFIYDESPRLAQTHLQTPLHADHDHKLLLKKAEKIEHSTPARKLSSSNFMKMARQASDTAFRTVGINRKDPNNNLDASWKTDHLESPIVYEQNPKVYLYQQQQQQSQRHQLVSPSGSERLHRSPSSSKIKVEYRGDVDEHTAGRVNSPTNFPCPDRTHSRSRSGSSPRVQAHHLKPDEHDIKTDVQELCASKDEDATQELHERTSRPMTPRRSPSRAMRNPIAQVVGGPPRNPLIKHPVLLDESLTGHKDDQLALCNKDLPPIPYNQMSQLLMTPWKVKVSNDSSQSHLELPTSSEAFKKSGRNGLIPQDVLKFMNSKEIKEAVSTTVVASRVYKVIGAEQLDILKKEQEELTDFIETMNTSLQIEARIRDASHSLIQLHESNMDIDALKSATGRLHATTCRMDQIASKIHEAMLRLTTIQRLLLQHEGAILNAGLRQLENENRELLRAVQKLDSEKAQEKEEKLTWKKEHNHLKFQSIVFSSTPVLEEFALNVSQNLDLQRLQLQHQEMIEFTEKYVKELNDDNLHKEEKLVELTNQLQAVKEWADDFASSFQNRHPVSEKPDQSPALQAQLRQLRIFVESKFNEIDLHASVLESKIELLAEENTTLTCNLKVLSAAHEMSYRDSQQDQLRRNKQAMASRAYHASHARPRPTTDSDLHMVLQDSLLELERQIQLDESFALLSSRPSSRSNSTASSDCMDDIDTSLSRSSSAGQSCGRSSHNYIGHGSSSSNKVRTQVRLVDVCDETEESECSSSDDVVVEDAHKEIQRLSTMIKELEHIVQMRRDVRVLLNNE